MRIKRKTDHVLAVAVAAMAVAQVLLAVVSWGVCALLPDAGLSSLLDGAGLRWLMGRFVGTLSSPLLVWIVVCASAVGCAVDSGVSRALRSLPRSPFRERVAIVFVVATIVVYVGFIVAFVVAPHAVLLSASGRLFPSPFSAALVPLAAFGVVLCSLVYGVASGRYFNLTQMFRSLYVGIAKSAPLIVTYIFATLLYRSFFFVFG